MAINNWYWKRYDTAKDMYADKAQALWKFDYRLTDDGLDRRGHYQVLLFRDEPGRYYIRPIPPADHPDMPDYTKASCLPKAFKYLYKAKDVAEMLEATNS